MIKKILIPADSGTASANALEIAIQIARSNKAILQILHISDNPGTDYNKSRDKTKIRHVYEAMAGSIYQKHGVSSEIIFAEGLAGPVIIRIAFEKRPDLIVMGSCDDSFDREDCIGSNANYVVKNADCPVLVIPVAKKSNAFETILYPVRSDRGNLNQFDFVRNITCGSGKNCQFEILALLVDSPLNGIEYVSGIVDDIEHEMMGEENVKLSISYSSIDIAEDVLEKAESVNADLLVIPSTIDVNDHEYFIGPFSQQIINQAKIPFLRVRAT